MLLELTSWHIVRYIKQCFIYHFAKSCSWLCQNTAQRRKYITSKFKVSLRFDTFNTSHPSKSLCSILLPNFFVNESLLYSGDGRNIVAFFIGKIWPQTLIKWLVFSYCLRTWNPQIDTKFITATIKALYHLSWPTDFLPPRFWVVTWPATIRVFLRMTKEATRLNNEVEHKTVDWAEFMCLWETQYDRNFWFCACFQKSWKWLDRFLWHKIIVGVILKNPSSLGLQKITSTKPSGHHIIDTLVSFWSNLP